MYGTVTVTDLGGVPDPERSSDRFRLGAGLSKAIVSSTEAVGNAVSVLGERNVELALQTAGFALGGIPKTLVNLAVGEQVDALTQSVLGPVEEATSRFIGRFAFDARTDGEFEAVQPVSKLAAGVTLGIFGGILTGTGGGFNNVLERLKGFRQARLDARQGVLERREREIELNFYKDSFIPENRTPRSSSVDFRPTGTPGRVDPSHLNELREKNVKHTPERIIGTSKTRDGQVVFLESGNSKAGLQHILERHGQEFRAAGISSSEVPDAVLKARTQGRIVGYQGRDNGRPIYEVEIKGVTQRIAITTGSNGFIVGANPVGRRQ